MCARTRRPAATARVCNVKIAVWENHGQNGDFFTASSPTIRQRRNDDKTGEFKDGSSYGAMDLLALSELAREASRIIREHTKAQNRGR